MIDTQSTQRAPRSVVGIVGQAPKCWFVVLQNVPSTATSMPSFELQSTTNAVLHNYQKKEIQAYFLYLVKERHLSAASCHLYFNAMRFLYVKVLGSDDLTFTFDIPKRKKKIPELLTQKEVARIINSAANLKWRTVLALCYGCGLRVSELTVLRVSDIDGERHLLRVTQGKGYKDRSVILSASLLESLRRYWQRFHPKLWLFYSYKVSQSYSISAIQRTYTHAKKTAGISKVGGIHSLRHAYASHQLAAGMPIHVLQQQLGHQDIHTTLRYVHWVPSDKEGVGVDLVANLGGVKLIISLQCKRSWIIICHTIKNTINSHHNKQKSVMLFNNAEPKNWAAISYTVTNALLSKQRGQVLFRALLARQFD